MKEDGLPAPAAHKNVSEGGGRTRADSKVHERGQGGKTIERGGGGSTVGIDTKAGKVRISAAEGDGGKRNVCVKVKEHAQEGGESREAGERKCASKKRAAMDGSEVKEGEKEGEGVPKKKKTSMFETLKNMYGEALEFVPQEWCRVCTSMRAGPDWKGSIYGERTLCAPCFALVTEHNLILPRIEPLFPDGIIPRKRKASPVNKADKSAQQAPAAPANMEALPSSSAAAESAGKDQADGVGKVPPELDAKGASGGVMKRAAGGVMKGVVGGVVKEAVGGVVKGTSGGGTGGATNSKKVGSQTKSVSKVQSEADAKRASGHAASAKNVGSKSAEKLTSESNGVNWNRATVADTIKRIKNKQIQKPGANILGKSVAKPVSGGAKGRVSSALKGHSDSGGCNGHASQDKQGYAARSAPADGKIEVQGMDDGDVCADEKPVGGRQKRQAVRIYVDEATVAEFDYDATEEATAKVPKSEETQKAEMAAPQKLAHAIAQNHRNDRAGPWDSSLPSSSPQDKVDDAKDCACSAPEVIVTTYSGRQSKAVQPFKSSQYKKNSCSKKKEEMQLSRKGAHDPVISAEALTVARRVRAAQMGTHQRVQQKWV